MNDTPTKLRPLALEAIGRTGADIERLVRETRRKVRRLNRDMTWDDLQRALTEAIGEKSADGRWRTAVHEAGHALLWIAFDLGEIESVFIHHADGNALRCRPKRDVVETEAYIQSHIAGLLAGRAAEQMMFGEVLAGAGGDPASDLAHATRLALKAETELGFSTHQPLIYRPVRDAASALAMDPDLAGRVDARLKAAEVLALSVLEANRETVLLLAKALNERGVLEGHEVIKLVGQPVIPKPAGK